MHDAQAEYERLEKALSELEEHLLSPAGGRKEWDPRYSHLRREEFRSKVRRFWKDRFDVRGYPYFGPMKDIFWDKGKEGRYAVILRLDRRLSTGLGFIRAGELMDKMYYYGEQLSGRKDWAPRIGPPTSLEAAVQTAFVEVYGTPRDLAIIEKSIFSSDSWQGL